MSPTNKTEIWLRGPLPGILPALQPVAHALLQAREEMNLLMEDFPDALLWKQPAGAASVGFHLQHMAGVLNRLFSYAQKQALSETQLQQLKTEGTCRPGDDAQRLVQAFNVQADISLTQLRNTPAGELFEARGVGRAQLPSTVMGLLVHAAEHTMRHLGQLLVTIKVVRAAAE